MPSTITRRALLGGLMAAGTATVAACSGQPARFQGGSGSRADSAGSGSGGGKNISMAVVAGWDDAVASSHLWKVLLEERGYTVNLRDLDIASTFTGVANGQVDLYMDAWLPGVHAEYWDRFEDQLEIVSEWSKGTLMLAVPTYVDIDSIPDLKGRSGDFGGRIVGVEAGAGHMRLMREETIPTYQLEEYTLVEGSTPAMLAELNSAIARQQNIVVTLWSPHWAFGRWDLKELADPELTFGEPDNHTTIAGKGFSEAQPEVAGWLKNFSMQDADLSGLMSRMQEAGSGNEAETVKQWAADNQDITDAWFEPAAANA